MTTKLGMILGLSFPMMMSCGTTKTASDTNLNNRDESSMVKVDPGTGCLAERDVSSALQRLSLARSQSEADQARELLINESKKSPACREQVIAVVMKAMDKPNLTVSGNPDLFSLWRDGAELLGDLKAAEALDLLISHLDLSSGLFSTTMSQQPALHSLIRMGPIAIPKLEAVLRHSPDPDMRRYAVYCISGIGGPSAKRPLQQALSSESDPCVSRFIRVSIDTINVKSGGLKNDTVKWFMAFQCQ